MATKLNKIAWTDGGEYASGKSYDTLTFVRYNEELWLNSVAGNTKTPSEANGWKKISTKGPKGDKGDKGDAVQPFFVVMFETSFQDIVDAFNAGRTIIGVSDDHVSYFTHVTYEEDSFAVFEQSNAYNADYEKYVVTHEGWKDEKTVNVVTKEDLYGFENIKKKTDLLEPIDEGGKFILLKNTVSGGKIPIINAIRAALSPDIGLVNTKHIVDNTPPIDVIKEVREYSKDNGVTYSSLAASFNEASLPEGEYYEIKMGVLSGLLYKGKELGTQSEGVGGFINASLYFVSNPMGDARYENSVDNLVIKCNKGDIKETDEAVFYHYANNRMRTGTVSRVRYHGWVIPRKNIPLVMSLDSSDDKYDYWVVRPDGYDSFVDTAGMYINNISLFKRSGIAIHRNNARISDFIRFRLVDNPNDNTNVLLARW